MYITENAGLGDDLSSCAPSTNCSAIAVDRFDKQPPDLQKVLTKSSQDPAGWFAKLSSDNRSALTSIFNRLCAYKLWCHVISILKIDDGEAPVLIADKVFKVPGRTPSVYFMSPSADALLKALMDSGKFCMARGIGASQHPGQTTLREISGSDSLHISIGPGNRFDAHIDKFSPVTEHAGSTFCSNNATVAAATHTLWELFPEGLRKKTGIPGGQPFPDFEMTPHVPRPEPTSRQDAGAPPPVFGVTMRGPVKSTPTRAARPDPLLPVQVITQIEGAIGNQVSPEALVPPHVLARRAQARKALEFAGPFEEDKLRKARDLAESEVASYPEPKLLALDLAERMEQARRNRVAWVKIDLPQYGTADVGSRKSIAGQIGKIALIVRNHLPDRAKDVRTIVIIFGSGNVATREEVKLP